MATRFPEVLSLGALIIRVVLSIVTLGLIGLGLWLIASGFTGSSEASVAAPQVISAPSQSVSPVVLGVALLGGGVIFAFLILRKQ